MSAERVVLVLGASGGIGQAVCRRLVRGGGVRVVPAAHPSDRLEALSAELGEDPVSLDATDLSAVDGVVAAVMDRWGRLDGAVNAVAPGLVRTAGTRSITERPAAVEASEALHPLGRLGEPEDVASAVAWFLDPSNSWVTGQVLGVDGGLAVVRAS